MKKLLFITTVAGLLVSQINVQAQGLYAGLGVGYGFPAAVQANPFPASSSTVATLNSGNSGTVTSSSYSLGAGLNIAAHVGYMLSKNVGLELGIADKLSTSTSTTQSTTYVDSLKGANAGLSATNTTTIKGSLFSVTPSLRLIAGDDGDKMRPYMVTGIVIGFPSAEVDMTGSGTEDFGNNVGIMSQTSTDKFSGGMIIGFHGALGMIFSLSDKIGIFGEVSCNLQNWSPSKDVMTYSETETGLGGTYENNVTTTTTYGSSVSTNSAAKNGTQIVTFSGISTSSTFNYNNGNGTSSKTINETNTSETINETDARNSNYTYLPFSAWAITIGVHFNFGGGGTPAAK